MWPKMNEIFTAVVLYIVVLLPSDSHISFVLQLLLQPRVLMGSLQCQHFNMHNKLHNMSATGNLELSKLVAKVE